MNVDNVDAWYDEQKEKIMQKYEAELKKGVKKDTAEKNFKTNMRKLHFKFNETSEKALNQPKIIISFKNFVRKFDKKSREIMTFLAENFGDEQ